MVVQHGRQAMVVTSKLTVAASSRSDPHTTGTAKTRPMGQNSKTSTVTAAKTLFSGNTKLLVLHARPQATSAQIDWWNDQRSSTTDSLTNTLCGSI
ncbi:hypothetical protein DH86_00004343 [Scytalidium sp. 3C]|nr:hypothetical protein DH86_00004343 [Scytalidium sp. 3C]